MQNVSDLFGGKMKRREKVVAPAGRLGVRQLAAALEFRVSGSKLDENSKPETVKSGSKPPHSEGFASKASLRQTL